MKALERDLSRTKGEVESVEEERRSRMDGVKGEIEALAELWRKGVGRALETEVAAEGLRRQILERRRGGG